MTCLKRRRWLVRGTSGSASKVCTLVAHPLPSPRAGEVGGTLVAGVLAVPAPPIHADLVQTEDVEKFQCALRRVEGLVRRNPLELPEVRRVAGRRQQQLSWSLSF